MLKGLMEVVACVVAFIGGDYTEPVPTEWYTRCENAIEDKSICYEQMTEEEFNIQWQKEEDIRKQLEAEQREIEHQQRQEQWEEIKEQLDVNNVQTIVNLIEFEGKPNMERLARLLNGTYNYESTIYGAKQNKNKQYVDVEKNNLHISLTKYRSGDATLSIQKDMEVVYTKTWEY